MASVGMQDNTAQLLQFVLQLQNMKRDKAAQLLGTLQPGESLGSIPGAEKAFKRVTGQRADPNRVLRPNTPALMLSADEVAALNNLSPETRSAMAKNRLLNTTTGTSGVQTQQSYETGQRTVESSARAGETAARAGEAVAATQDLTAQAGLEKTRTTPKEELGAAGQRMALGETAAQTRTAETQAKTVQSYQEYAQRFLADPTNSAWGRMLTSIGLDPKGVTEAFASGQDAVLGGILDLKKMERVTGESIEEYLAKRRIDSAKVMSEKLGGRVPIRTILALEQAVEMGQDPFTSGVSGQDVALWLKARELGSSAYLREQIAKENPTAKAFQTMVEALKNFSDKGALNSVNNGAAWLAAQTLTEGDLGLRPGLDNKEGQTLWDERARYHFNTLGIIGKTMNKFLGIEIPATGDIEATQQPGFMQGTPADTTTPGARPRGAAAPPDVTGQPPKAPMFQDPSAAAAVQGALNLGRDSTFVRR